MQRRYWETLGSFSVQLPCCYIWLILLFKSGKTQRPNEQRLTIPALGISWVFGKLYLRARRYALYTCRRIYGEHRCQRLFEWCVHQEGSGSGKIIRRNLCRHFETKLKKLSQRILSLSLLRKHLSSHCELQQPDHLSALGREATFQRPLAETHHVIQPLTMSPWMSRHSPPRGGRAGYGSGFERRPRVLPLSPAIPNARPSYLHGWCSSCSCTPWSAYLGRSILYSTRLVSPVAKAAPLGSTATPLKIIEGG